MTASDFLDARVARPDLPPSEWSKISVILDHEGVWEWARGTSRKRLSASCVRLRSCWRGAGRQRMRVGGSRSPSRPIIAGARSMEIGRAHVWTPVTNAHLVCRLLLEKKKNNQPHKNN